MATTAKKTTTKKTTTTKTAAKKTTTAKPAAKKTTTTAKPAVKKTSTTAKPAAKKTAPVKTAVEISVNGNKKIETLMKEFNKQFPYLRLSVCYSYARQAVAKGESLGGSIDINKTLASVRRADSGGDISISGNKKVKTLEKEFDTVFGLYVQVCYTANDGHRYYTGSSSDEMTLSALNKKCEANGCKKGEWK
ncbi:MAG: hypothetical protein II887_02830 [Bacteroidales bacterium]|nr:hypothetical protein [Bacteroidales bacterium]